MLPNYPTISSILAFLTLFSVSSLSFAIGFGEPDGNRHPSIGSLRYIFNNLDARISCTGELIYKDADKYVILTAAHCSQPELDGWNSVAPGLGSVGVSFNEFNLPDDTDPTDGGADGVEYVSGGVSIEHPLYRFPGNSGFNDTYDIDLVIIPTNAKNSYGQTIAQLWGNLPVMPVAGLNYNDALIAQKFANQNLVAVGYGTSPTKSPIGSGSGNKVKGDSDASFPNRNLAYILYKNANGAMINVATQMNAQGVTGTLCAGDSGGPLLLKMPDGKELILGVLTAGSLGNCANSTGGYSRIDLPAVVKFLSCASVPGNAAAVKACVDNQFK